MSTVKINVSNILDNSLSPESVHWDLLIPPFVAQCRLLCPFQYHHNPRSLPMASHYSGVAIAKAHLIALPCSPSYHFFPLTINPCTTVHQRITITSLFICILLICLFPYQHSKTQKKNRSLYSHHCTSSYSAMCLPKLGLEKWIQGYTRHSGTHPESWHMGNRGRQTWWPMV